MSGLLNGVPARTVYPGGVGAIKLDITYATPGIASGVSLDGALPDGAHALAAYVNITEVFNATSSNVLVVGTSANDDAFVEAGDVDETALGMTQVLRGAGLVSGDTQVFVKFTETGTAASTGAATVIVTYVE